MRRGQSQSSCGAGPGIPSYVETTGPGRTPFSNILLSRILEFLKSHGSTGVKWKRSILILSIEVESLSGWLGRSAGEMKRAWGSHPMFFLIPLTQSSPTSWTRQNSDVGLPASVGRSLWPIPLSKPQWTSTVPSHYPWPQLVHPSLFSLSKNLGAGLSFPYLRLISLFKATHDVVLGFIGILLSCNRVYANGSDWFQCVPF